jgi:hypothetical protein
MCCGVRIAQAEGHRDRWTATVLLESVAGVLESIGVPYALTGGYALAMRGYPNLTIDFELLTIDRRVLESGIWDGAKASGARVEIREGDADDVLAGIVRVTVDSQRYVDVFVSKATSAMMMINRAERMPVVDVSVPVLRASDLLLDKLADANYSDLLDAHLLFAATNRAQLIREVEEHIAEVRPDVSEEWNRIKLSTSDERRL